MGKLEFKTVRCHSLLFIYFLTRDHKLGGYILGLRVHDLNSIHEFVMIFI